MALIIRSARVRPIKPPCGKECEGRKVGCHSDCQKFTDWKKKVNERKAAIRKYNQSIADVEEYEIKERQKRKREG